MESSRKLGVEVTVRIAHYGSMIWFLTAYRTNSLTE